MKSTLAVAVLLLGAGIASASPNHVANSDRCTLPPVYMDYDQAVALIKQQQMEAQRPLGDVARELRAKKALGQKTPTATPAQASQE